MEISTYTILMEKRPDVEKKLKRYEKKANKYGILFEVTFGDGYAIDVVRRDDSGRKWTEKYEVFDLTITSDIIRKDGYTVVARIEHAMDGNIVNVFTGEMKVQWAKIPAHCDHCNGNHNQKITFIVRKGDDEKQVGRTCLKEYCGIDPQMVGIYNQFIDEIEEYNPDIYDFSEGITCVYDSVKVIATAIEVIREQGYRKSGEKDSNKSVVAKRLANNEHVSEDAFKEAESMAEAIALMPIDVAVDANLNNVQTRIKGLYCKPSDFGYFAYAPLAYEKYLERIEKEKAKEAEKAAIAEKSNYVGTEGQRMEIDVAETRLLTTYTGEYGTTFIYRFIDTLGNVLIWFGSNHIDETTGKIKATVKSHSVRDGVKQTIITRVKRIA